MNIKQKLVTGLATGAIALTSIVPAAFASSTNGMEHRNSHKLSASMTGGQEAPVQGDPDGIGDAKVKLLLNQEKLCITMRVQNIDPATAAHIHEAPVGSAGPVVVPLPTPDASGFAKGCVSLERAELEEIAENPSNYYVNVHNTAYPGGAARGQLSH